MLPSKEDVMSKIVVFMFSFIFFVISAASSPLNPLCRMNENQWRAYITRTLQESDSIFNRYGNHDLFDQSIVGDSIINQQLPEVAEAFQAFARQRITLEEITENIPDFINKAKDTQATEIRNIFSRVHRNWLSSGAHKMWLYTCKAASLVDSTMTLLKRRYIPSDTLYSKMRDRVRNLTDSIQATPKQNVFNDDAYFYITSEDYAVNVREKRRYPCNELLYVLLPALDTGALFVPRLNALFKQEKFAEMVSLLRSKDYRGRGPIKYHSLGFLFFQYSIVDSLLFSKYESEIFTAVKKRQGKRADLLIQKLENNTDFLFPHAIAKKKHELRKEVETINKRNRDSNSCIVKFFNKIKQIFLKILKVLGLMTKDKDKEVQLDQPRPNKIDTTIAPFFFCCYSNVINKEDVQLDGKRLLCLAPSATNICNETVREVVFSSKDYFSLHPNEERREWNEGNRVVYIDGRILPANDSYPYLLFYNVPGLSSGSVEKAEVYELTKNTDIAYIENDSLIITYDITNRTPSFPGVDSVDDSFAECVLCSHYISWIGDVNRNNKIEIIIENFASQYGNRVFFLEKQVIGGECILKAIMSHNKYSYD
jgi:hypothetical protein